MKSGDEKKNEKKMMFDDFSAILHSYSYLDDFKIIPGDLRQALDELGINPGRSLDEARMTPRWTQRSGERSGGRAVGRSGGRTSRRSSGRTGGRAAKRSGGRSRGRAGGQEL